MLGLRRRGWTSVPRVGRSTGVTEAAVKRIKNGRIDLIPASNETRGHLTTGDAKFYARQLQELLQTAPQRTM
jgi:homoserine O-acetyltransferase/O-succinyltransferase